MKVGNDLYNYGTIADLKIKPGVYIDFAKMANLSSLISDIDTLDIVKLGTTPAELNERSNVEEKEFDRSSVFDEQVKKT